MDVMTVEHAYRLLESLVAIPSVNPMGRPHTGPVPIEKDVNDYIRDLLSPYGLQMERRACSARHENLLITVPGAAGSAAVLFEAHVDTVPADEWADRAFKPRRVGGDVFGRGSCDDKGSLAAMILAIRDLLENQREPPLPILFLAAGDEEFAQTGIKHFVQENRTIRSAIFGEGTQLAPVIQHKGTVRWDITVHGRSAHSSQPELGRNAITDMMRVIEAIGQYQGALQVRHVSPLMSGPTITVTQIEGGRTRNAVPDACRVAVDFRVLPGMEPGEERQRLMAHLESLGLSISHSGVQLKTPPLNTSPKDPFSLRVLEICRRHVGPQVQLSGVPYGTDASWVSDRAPAIVLGPGSIADAAHAVDEHVSIEEVVTCARIYRDIMLADVQP